MIQHSRIIGLCAGFLAVPILVTGLLAAPASADTIPGGTVKGTVTLNGVPLAGAKVSLVRRDGDSGDAYQRYKTVTTNQAGRYSLTRPQGSSTTWWYEDVVVSDPSGRAVTARRDFNWSRSRAIVRNVAVKPAASITGKITRADGAPAGSITAEIVEGPDSSLIENLDMVRYDVDRTASANGFYRFDGLPAGTYSICFRDASATYQQECYDEAFGATQATGVDLKKGADVRLKNQVLDHRYAHLRGTVTSTSGERLRGITVRAVDREGGWNIGETRTWSSGQYDLAAEAPARARLRFEDPNGIWASRWYRDADTAPTRVFTLAEGGKVDGLQIALKSKAKVAVAATSGSRKVTFRVEVTRRATGRHPAGKITVSRKGVTSTVDLKKGVGTVTLTGLPAGKRTFRVEYAGSPSTAAAGKTVKVTVR